MASRLRTRQKENSCQRTNGVDFEHELKQLNDNFERFRAEIDMKMVILEQVLSTRNETFSMQKKLLEREQSLLEEILSQWKNIPQFAATGLSLRFSSNESDGVGLRVTNNTSSATEKHSHASATLARRNRKRKRKTKRLDLDSESSSEEEGEKDPLSLEESVDEINPEADGCEGFEPDFVQKEFVNCYDEACEESGTLSNGAKVWKYYLREQDGDSTLCKLCDEKDVQTILKARKRSLYNHLKLKHNVNLNISELNGEADVRTREKTAKGMRLHSPIWNHFTKLQDSETMRGRCNHCFQKGVTTEYKIYDGSTSILHYHLKTIHRLKSSDSGTSRTSEHSQSHIKDEKS